MSYISTAAFCFTVLTTLSQASGFDGIPEPNFNISELGSALTNISELGLPELPRAGSFSTLSFFDVLNRSKRQTESTNGTSEEETQGEAPVSKNPMSICNSTQMTHFCLNCRQVLICSKNFGILRSCFGFRPYCNEGRCTDQQPTDCGDV